MNQYPLHLEAVLDSCVTAVQERDLSVSACLEMYPERRDVLEPLLQLTQRLQAGQAVQPRPEFRQAAPRRMQNLIAALPRPASLPQAPIHTQPNRPLGRRWLARWWQGQARSRQIAVAFSLILCICLLLGSVTVYAANDTVPGHALYPVKLVVENTRLVLSFDEVEKAKLHLSFAARRLEETAVLLKTGSTSPIQQPLNAYQLEIESMKADLEEGSPLTTAQKQTLAQLLVINLDQHEEQLTNLINQTTADARASLQSALTASQLVHNQAFILVTGAPDETIPAPTATATPLSPTATVTATTTSLPATPTATAVPPTRTPIPSPRIEFPPTIPPDCLSPPTELEPKEWAAWLERCVGAVDPPPQWLEDLPEAWPIPSPFSTPPAPDEWQTPPPLSLYCAFPPNNLDPQAWQDWLEQCNIPTAEPPPGWPELPPTAEWETSPDQLPPPPDEWNPPDDLPPTPDEWNPPGDLPPTPDNWPNEWPDGWGG